MSSAYSFSGGSLRLKGDSSSTIQSGKVSKKHKHKHKSKSSNTVEAPSSKMQHVASIISTTSTDQPGPSRRDLRTPAEIAYDEAMAKRAEEKVLRKAAKSHKEQVEELNSYLDKLTEYNDIPKVSWTK
jgi:protein FAM32A